MIYLINKHRNGQENFMKLTSPAGSALSCATILAMLFISPLLLAANSENTKVSDQDKMRHESTGVIGGAVIGGLVGGPIGAVVTAAFGSWVSDKTLAKKENQFLTTELDRQQKELIAMQADYRALQARYQVAQRQEQTTRLRNASIPQSAKPVQPEYIQCCSDTELSLHFKTNSTGIEPFYNDKLLEFTSIAKKYPDAVIEITGHADRRGDSEANLALSRGRIQTIEQRLRSNGLTAASLQTNAYGESKPASAIDSLENNFFDRRVIVKLLTVGNGLLSRSND
jgi:sortase system peptidoglycan-associated protein